MINTRLFATVLERLVLFPTENSFMTKNDFVKASRGKFSKTQQIYYSTVTCFKWPTTAMSAFKRLVHFNEKPLVRYTFQ